MKSRFCWRVVKSNLNEARNTDSFDMKKMNKMMNLDEVLSGNIPPDTVFTKATLFNALTREFVKDQSLWVKNGFIAYVGSASDFPKNQKTQCIDADGMVLLPGLIEGHTHTLSQRYSIEEFIKHVIPSGVTTVITETMELAIIVGKEAIEYFAKGLKDSRLEFITRLPLSVVSLRQKK